MKDLKQVICSTVILILAVIAISAQSGGTFTITKSVIAGGGGHSDGGTFGLDGSIGQPFGGATSSGGTFSLTSGFWSPVAQASPTPAGSIAGTISYAIVTKAVPDVTVSASGSPSTFSTTDGFGSYLLSNLGAGAYTVTPAKPTQQCGLANGIFSADAARISQFVVGLRTFNANELIAADVSGLGSVSSNDAALIARRVVGLCTSPVNLGGTWVFMPANRQYASVMTSIGGEDYTAILKGDVDGDWNPAGPNRPFELISDPNAIEASVPSLTAVSGSAIDIPVSFGKLDGVGVTSYQFDIEYDPMVLEAAEVAADIAGTRAEGLTVVSNVVMPGLLKVAVYGALPVDGDGVYANLRFTAIGTSGMSTYLTIREVRLNNTSYVRTVGGQIKVVGPDSKTQSKRLTVRLKRRG